MEAVADELAAVGFDAVTPRPDRAYALDQTPSSVVNAKREASMDYFEKIKDRKTRAILVINVDRENNRDYIGPNSFAEIAVAFAERREIFLFQGMPRAYADELTAWGARCLHGDLGRLREFFCTPNSSMDHEIK
jgi:hypothetical protein